MVHIDLKELVGKLDETCRRSLEAAAGYCLSRTNYNVEIEHWLLKLMEVPNTDFSAILNHFDVDTSRMSADLTRVIDGFKTGNARAPSLSPNVVDLVREAWLVCSVNFGGRVTRSGHLLLALLSDETLARIAKACSPALSDISSEALRQEFANIVASTGEASEAGQAVVEHEEGAPRKLGPTKTPSLDQYTIDLTDRAQRKDIDPVLGRDIEIRQIIDILTRRRQNNPILTGEAGVGKTAVVEGFALRVSKGDVPPPLQNVSIRTLDLGLLQAGAGVKGEFENRLKSVIQEVKASPTPIILFIDEAHTMIGAGGQAGQSDAANLLKPALARGELRTIAATTWAEYKKYFEKDAALARRFQVVRVEEPSEDAAVIMLRGLLQTLEEHHGVRILNEALVEAVKLSARYISGRQLPDKAVSLLDTTCARIGLSQTATPPAVEDCQRRIEQLETSIAVLKREAASGADNAALIEQRDHQLQQAEDELKQLDERWNQENELVTRIRQLQTQLEGGQMEPATASEVADESEAAATGESAATSESAAAADDADTATAESTAAPQSAATPLSDADRDRLCAELTSMQEELRELQGETPLVFPCVNSAAVAETVGAWTGIPVGRMVADEIKTVLNLKSLMEQSIVGQSHALEAISQRIRTSRANLDDPRTPIGVFLLAGMSGVGKTETGITLANLLYGGEQNMTVLNMSEYKEEYRVSGLIGSPKGYVGYGEGGVLTEAVRRKPYSVVLLDEMEKAHPSVQDLFYQVFDKGILRDGEGRDIDFKNTVILMTTNAGTDLIKSLCADPDTRPEPDAFTKAIFPELLNSFKPAFLGRMVIVPYYPLSDEVMQRIIRLKLGKIARRVQENHRAEFSYADDLVATIGARCTEVDTGARNVDHILTQTLLPEMSAEFLARMAEGAEIGGVHVSVGDAGEFRYEISEKVRNSSGGKTTT